MYLPYWIKISCEKDRKYISKHSNNTFFDVQNKRTVFNETVALANIFEKLEDSERITIRTFNMKC